LIYKYDLYTIPIKKLVTTTNGIIPSQSTTGTSNSHHHNHHTNITNHDTSTNGGNNVTIENSKILPISDINSTNTNSTKLNGTSTTTNNNNKQLQQNDVNKENIPINTTTTTTTTSPNSNNLNRNIQKNSDSSISPTPLSQNIYSTTTSSNTNSILTGGIQSKNDNQIQSKSPNFLNGVFDENSDSPLDPQQITEITISNLNGSNLIETQKSITPIPEIDSKENLLADLNNKPTTATATIATITTNLNESSGNTTTNSTKIPLGQTVSLNPATQQLQPSSIPTPIQSNSRALSGSSTSSNVRPHQRGITHIGSGIGNAPSTTTTATSNAIRLKKSDTVRGTSDFPKSASTDKSRIESFLSRNLPNSSLHTQDRVNVDNDAIRTSHSYRTKTELLQQNSNLPQHTAAAATVGTASLLASNSLSNNHNSVKSQSAAPIKQNENSASGSASSQKSDLRPRLGNLMNLRFLRNF
jgi:hypothetical protein